MSSLRLSSRTLLGKEELKKVNLILQSLIDHNQSVEFRQPVDWKAMSLTDYPLIVKNPMDLGTVKKKLLNSKYKYAEQILDDIQLIWDNCKLYNAPCSWIFVVAERLQRNFKKHIKNYLPFINVVVPGKNNPPKDSRQTVEEMQEPLTQQISYSQKIKLTQRMRFLSQEQLGVIVKLIQTSCAEAFRELQKDRVQVLVDNLDVETFDKINEQIELFSDKKKKPSD